MGAEFLLYGYGLVCLSMILFNCLYSLYLRAGDARLERQARRLERAVSAQLQRLREGQEVELRHRRRMSRILARVGNLLAFDRILAQLPMDEISQQYLRQMQPVILYLATVYRRRENTQAAYFCYFLIRNRLQRHMQMDEVQRVIAGYMDKDSMYCRVNALKALCAFGSAQTVVDVLLDQNRKGTFFHSKVLVETLMTFTGDYQKLIGLLWERLEQFSISFRRAVLDYIRFRSGDYCPQMLKILLDHGQDKELRFSAIRYFGRYPYPPARKTLLEFVSDLDPQRWEYAAISATSLARYPGQDAEEALLRAMHSGNWYVRYNAAASLEALGVTYEQMIAAAGEDRYAREMLLYRLENRRMAERARAEREQERPAPPGEKKEALV